MASIDFPNAPANGDSVNINGITYTYDSAKTLWKSTESSNVVVAITVDFAASTANSAIIIAGNASNRANAASNTANTACVTAGAAFTRANIGYAHANVAFNSANAAFSTANVAFNTANVVFTAANSASNTFLVVALSDESTPLTTGEKIRFRAPYAMTLYQLPRISVNTASSSGLVRVDIREAGTTIFSTNLTIDANETTSTTALTSAALNDTSIADDAIISFHVIEAGTGATGLKSTLYFRRA